MRKADLIVIAGLLLVIVGRTRAHAHTYRNLTEEAYKKAPASAFPGPRGTLTIAPGESKAAPVSGGCSAVGAFSAAYPFCAGRLFGSQYIDRNSSDNVEWAASDTFSGWFRNSANQVVALYNYTNSMGMKILPPFDSIGGTMWAPGAIVTVPPYGTGICGIQIPIGSVTCQSPIQTGTYEYLSLNTLPTYNENQSNVAWGAPRDVSALPGGLAQYGQLSPPHGFDEWISNVAINPLPIGQTLVNGTGAVVSTPHGLIGGYLTSMPTPSPTMAFNSGIPTYLGGLDFANGSVVFENTSLPTIPNHTIPNRYWHFIPTAGSFISGDIGANVYVSDHTGCYAPVGRILGTNKYDAIQSFMKNGPIVEAYHPNIYRSYYSATVQDFGIGLILQPTGSCVAQYPL